MVYIPPEERANNKAKRRASYKCPVYKQLNRTLIRLRDKDEAHHDMAYYIEIMANSIILIPEGAAVHKLLQQLQEVAEEKQ